jgi:hypothetical protein
MPGSMTTPGRPALAMTRSDVLPSTICTVSAPKIGLFRGSMAGLCTPLSTLRRDPRGPLRMTWGRCGSLLLHRKGLSPSTPCRSPGASHILSALAPSATEERTFGIGSSVPRGDLSRCSKRGGQNRGYSITSSARASGVGGMSRPIVLAVCSDDELAPDIFAQLQRIIQRPAAE